MSASAYKKVIAKTLRDSASAKFRSTDELADLIVSKMESFDEMKVLLTDEPVHVRTTQPGESLIIPATTIPDRATLPPPQFSERIMPQQTEYTDADIVALKQRAFQNYQATLPPTIDVVLPGSDKPVSLRRDLKNSPGAFSFIKVQYLPPGASQGIEISVNVTDGETTSAQIIEDVKRQAVSWYSAAPRKVVSAPPPPPASLEAQMIGAPSGDADRAASASDAAEFSRSVWGGGPVRHIEDSVSR